MSIHKSPMPSRESDQLSSAEAWKHVIIWILLVVAALLLVGFTAVVDDMTQRGDLRRVHQSASGSLPLPDDLSHPGIDLLGILSLTGHKLVGR